MKSLQDIYSLKRAGSYQRPRRASDALPLVYGDLNRQGEGGGVWQAVCIDSQAHVYALAGAPILAREAGNQVRLFDNQGDEVFGFTFNPAHDFQGQGLIATATLDQDLRAWEPLSVAAKGRANANGLLLNPIAILQDFLLELAGLEPDQLDGVSWARAQRRAQEQGYQAAGVITDEQSLGGTLSQILGCFLGSWWLDAAGRLRVALEGTGLRCLESEVAHSFAAVDTLEVQVSADIKNTCNRVVCQYAYNWDADAYESYEDGETTRDPLSQSLYEEQVRYLNLPWVRLPAVVRRVQEAAIRRFSGGARLLTLEAPGRPTLHLEKGDHAWFSSSWLRDRAGRIMTDELVRVLSLQTDLDAFTTRFTLEDTGYRQALAWLADGSGLADGSVLAGAEPLLSA